MQTIFVRQTNITYIKTPSGTQWAAVTIQSLETIDPPQNGLASDFTVNATCHGQDPETAW